MKPQTTFPATENSLRLIPIDVANSQSMMTILGSENNGENGENGEQTSGSRQVGRFFILHV
jgi:hypothetical protein